MIVLTVFASRCKHGAQWVAASARQRLAGEEPGEGAEVSVVLLPREFPFLRVESCDFTSEHIDSFRLSRFLMMSLRVSRAWGSWRRTRSSADVPPVPVAGAAAQSRGVVHAVLVAVEVEGDERPQGRRALSAVSDPGGLVAEAVAAVLRRVF